MCEKKKCTKCGVVLRVDEFPLKHDKNKPGSRYSWCWDCKRASNRVANMSEERIKRKRERDKEYSKLEEKKRLKNEYHKEWRKTSDAYKARKSTNVKTETKIVFINCKCGAVEVVKERSNNRTKCIKCANRESFKKNYHKNKNCKVKGSVHMCIECQHSFIANGGRAKYCKACSKAIRNKTKLRGSHDQRARKYGVYAIYVDSNKVFKRDKWRCKECGVRVVKYNGEIKNNTATLGHIVPMSLGGSHTYSNVQCECWKCNTYKGNKAQGQQITIFDNVIT